MPEKLPTLTPEFRSFLIEAKQHGYGTPDADVTELESGQKQIRYPHRDAEPQGQYLYVDNFVGGDMQRALLEAWPIGMLGKKSIINFG